LGAWLSFEQAITETLTTRPFRKQVAPKNTSAGVASGYRLFNPRTDDG
jgi:hypothetical protein